MVHKPPGPHVFTCFLHASGLQICDGNSHFTYVFIVSKLKLERNSLKLICQIAINPAKNASQLN